MNEHEFEQKFVELSETYPKYLQELYANDLGWVGNHIVRVRNQMPGFWDDHIAREYFIKVRNYLEDMKSIPAPEDGQSII